MSGLLCLNSSHSVHIHVTLYVFFAIKWVSFTQSFSTGRSCSACNISYFRTVFFVSSFVVFCSKFFNREIQPHCIWQFSIFIRLFIFCSTNNFIVLHCKTLGDLLLPAVMTISPRKLHGNLHQDCSIFQPANDWQCTASDLLSLLYLSLQGSEQFMGAVSCFMLWHNWTQVTWIPFYFKEHRFDGFMLCADCSLS